MEKVGIPGLFSSKSINTMVHEINLQLIEIENENYHILVKSTFNDGTKGYWVVDTGASKTVFDINKSSHFLPDEISSNEIYSAGIGEGQIETSCGTIEGIVFGKTTPLSIHVALINLSHINVYYEKATDIKICGLLGSDFLIKHKAIINFKKKKLYITIKSPRKRK